MPRSANFKKPQRLDGPDEEITEKDITFQEYIMESPLGTLVIGCAPMIEIANGKLKVPEDKK